MGSKHAKKRYFIVRYNMKLDGKFDELVELSKKKLGVGKIAGAKVILDLLNKEIEKTLQLKYINTIPMGIWLNRQTMIQMRS